MASRRAPAPNSKLALQSGQPARNTTSAAPVMPANATATDISRTSCTPDIADPPNALAPPFDGPSASAAQRPVPIPARPSASLTPVVPPVLNSEERTRGTRRLAAPKVWLVVLGLRPVVRRQCFPRR